MKREQKLEKLEALLERWTHPECQGKKSSRVPKGISLLDVRVLEHIYFSLVHGEKVRFLVSSLVSDLEKCGVKVDYPHDDEVNYVAYP